MTLIIAIGIMLILALMGWTVVNFAVGDYYSAARFGQSQKALYLAEAGISWAKTNASCLDGNLSPVTHNLAGGQYQVFCNASGAYSWGYLPSQANYTVMRGINVGLGSLDFSYCVEANNNFTFSDANRNIKFFNGNIIAQNYSTDGNAVVNEIGFFRDYNPLPGPIFPLGDSSGERTQDIPKRYPLINMDYFFNASNATGTVWPSGNVSAALAGVFPLGNQAGTDYSVAQMVHLQGNAASRTISSIRILHGPNIGVPAGNITVRVEDDTGGAPSGTLAVGTAVPSGSTTLSAEYAPASSNWNNIVFPNGVEFDNNQDYWIVLNATAQANDNYYTVRMGYYTGGKGAKGHGPGWKTQNDPGIVFSISPASKATDLTWIYTADPAFFNSMNNMVVRDVSRGGWADTNNWAVISGNPVAVSGELFNGTRVQVSRPVLDLWNAGDILRLGRRFYNGNDGASDHSLWYSKGDALIDNTASAAVLPDTSIVAQGDIAVLGNAGNLAMDSRTAGGYVYPVMATQSGNVYSPDGLTGRAVRGLIYSQEGSVVLGNISGNSVVANHTYFYNRANFTYNASEVNFPPSSFSVNSSVSGWMEK